MSDDGTYRNPIVTEVAPLGPFYPAEDYHREYFARNPTKPYCRAVIAPKLAKFRSHWKSKLKTAEQEQRV